MAGVVFVRRPPTHPTRLMPAASHAIRGLPASELFRLTARDKGVETQDARSTPLPTERWIPHRHPPLATLIAMINAMIHATPTPAAANDKATTMVRWLMAGPLTATLPSA